MAMMMTMRTMTTIIVFLFSPELVEQWLKGIQPLVGKQTGPAAAAVIAIVIIIIIIVQIMIMIMIL